MLNDDVDGYWRQFIEQLYNRYSKIWPAAELFAEALRCFRSEAYFGTCAMCRSAVEALLHIAKTRKGEFEREPDPDTRFSDLLNWAKKDGLLQGISGEVEAIRKIGDFSVHLAHKIDKGYAEMVPNSVVGIKIGVSKDEARQTILNTVEVMLQVINGKWPEQPSEIRSVTLEPNGVSDNAKKSMT
jgi:hypothetical protein